MDIEGNGTGGNGQPAPNRKSTFTQHTRLLEKTRRQRFFKPLCCCPGPLKRDSQSNLIQLCIKTNQRINSWLIMSTKVAQLHVRVVQALFRRQLSRSIFEKCRIQTQRKNVHYWPISNPSIVMKNGANDGARTRDLRRDRPTL